MDDTTSRGVITQSTEGIWEWKPESTGYKANYFNCCKIIQHCYRRWEHVTFAFLISENKPQVFRIDNLDMQMTYCPPSSVFRQHTTINTKEWSINETLQFFCDKDNAIPNDTFFLGFIHRFLIKNWQKDDKQYEGMPHKKYMALNPRYLVQILGGSLDGDQNKQYTYMPYELLEMARDLENCKDRWQLWIRQIAHYLLND